MPSRPRATVPLPEEAVLPALLDVPVPEETLEPIILDEPAPDETFVPVEMDTRIPEEVLEPVLMDEPLLDGTAVPEGAVGPALLGAGMAEPSAPVIGVNGPGTVDTEMGGEGLALPGTGVNGGIPVVYRGAITRSRANRN